MISNHHETSSEPVGASYYTFSGFDDSPNGKTKKEHRRGGRRRNPFSLGKSKKDKVKADDGSVGNGSLTYSTGSSVQSAGESTDSSAFADILKVLDNHDDEKNKPQRRLSTASTHSATSSLNYSTDGESQLEGSKLLAAAAGTSSEFLLGDIGQEDEEEPFDIMFAPAAPATPRRKKKGKNKDENKEVEAKTEAPKAPTPAPTTKQGEQQKPEPEKQKPVPKARREVENPKNRSSASSPVPSVSSKTVGSKASPKNRNRNSKQDKEEEEERDWWRCELLEESLPESVPNTVNKFKNVLRPYLCFL